jgi:tRNA1Val (adenine37-N6)-methyltransferase
MVEEPDELGELTNDAIAGALRITQRKHGHRYSLDDVLTAWEAAASAPHARRCLELGSGIGSVLLMLAYKLPDAQFTAVEAQRNSVKLLGDNVRDNGLSERVRLIHGDLRSTFLHERFDLITGTPPYVPVGTATPASDAQKVYARQELRGGVEAYLEAIGRCLSEDGIGVVCCDARSPQRAFDGAARAGLHVVRRRDAVPRAGKKGALFSIYTVSRQARAFEHAEPWIARDEDGARSADYLAVRAFFGLTPRTDEPPSP